jgi:hypothetical protein
MSESKSTQHTVFYINYESAQLTHRKFHSIEDIKNLARLRAAECKASNDETYLSLMSSLEESIIQIKSTFISIIMESQTFEEAFNAVNHYYCNFCNSLNNIKDFDPTLCLPKFADKIKIFHKHVINVSEILMLERCEFDSIKFHVNLLVPETPERYFSGIDLLIEYQTRYGVSNTYNISLLINTFMLNRESIKKICDSCNALLDKEHFISDNVIEIATREGLILLAQR